MEDFFGGFEKRASMKNMRSGLEMHEEGGSLNKPETPRPGVGIQPKFTPVSLPTYKTHHPKQNTKPVLPAEKPWD